jgi:hypothetical protein
MRVQKGPEKENGMSDKFIRPRVDANKNPSQLEDAAVSIRERR